MRRACRGPSAAADRWAGRITNAALARLGQLWPAASRRPAGLAACSPATVRAEKLIAFKPMRRPNRRPARRKLARSLQLGTSISAGRLAHACDPIVRLAAATSCGRAQRRRCDVDQQPERLICKLASTSGAGGACRRHRCCHRRWSLPSRRLVSRCWPSAGVTSTRRHPPNQSDQRSIKSADDVTLIVEPQ
jgi:hypothetical protein